MITSILDDRAVLSIAGEEAHPFLQGLVSADIGRLGSRSGGQLSARGNLFGALLTPQGKIQFDFFLHAAENGFLIDIDKTQADAFLKRLTLYRLRSKVTFEDASARCHVAVAWDEENPGTGAQEGHTDARLAALGTREITERPQTPSAAVVSPDAYHARRIALGVPEAGKDFAYGDIFPHDAMMDALRGIDFKKGCYVGQEVVSRVEHRASARKRFYIVTGKAVAQSVFGAAIVKDGKAVGALGSISGTTGLALLRTDHAGDGGVLSLNGHAVEARLPDYFIRFQAEKTR